MAKSVVAYDRDLPEIPDRRPWERPTSFLVKGTDPGSWLVDDSGRRPSNLLLVNKLRAAVDTWREQGYPGASNVTQRLFEYWFEEDHEVADFPVPFRYHFCQREAMETLAYIVEIAQILDAKVLVNAYAEVFRKDLFEYNLVHETTMDGKRRLRRYFPELDAEGTQDLPPEDLPRFAFKMATGSGKTWVMAMAVVWSHFHKKRVPDSPLSTNFLILAPNVIVYQRLEKDFSSNQIFYDLPLVPPEWRPWTQKVILRGESTEPDPSGNLFLTNITDAEGGITKGDLEKAREAARDIDKPSSKTKAIVSVMMLREGWDVRNVSVVLGLRPFTAKAEILPEQVIGRGLRLMIGIGPDRTQTLEVLGTRNLLDVLRDKLEAEGVSVAATKSDPPQSITIYPMQERLAFDIAIPLTKPVLTHNVKKLSLLDPTTFAAIYDLPDLEETFRVTLKMEFVTTETEIYQEDLAAGTALMAQELLSAITDKVIQKAKLTNAFAELYPIVRCYIVTRCFGEAIESTTKRSALTSAASSCRRASPGILRARLVS